MKIASTSAAFRYGAPVSSKANATDQRFDADIAVSESGKSADQTTGFPSRGFANVFSEMQFDTAEPSRAEKAKASGKAAEAELGKWAKMSPTEKIRALILGQHGQTEETFKAIPKEEREAIEKEIQEAIKRHYGLNDQGSSGVLQIDAASDVSRA